MTRIAVTVLVAWLSLSVALAAYNNLLRRPDEEDDQ